MAGVAGGVPSAEASPRFCPSCGSPVPPNARFCPYCAAPQPGALGATGPPSGFAPIPPLSSPFGRVTSRVSPAEGADRDRTITGLLLLGIGFALSWIPYILYIGGLLALIGIIFLFLGRRGFGQLHHRNVVIGGVLFVLTLLAGIIVAVGFVAGVISQLPSPGTSLSGFGAMLESDLATLFLATLVVGILAALSQVIMVYALADPTTRILLWAGFVSGAVLTGLIYLILFPEIATAVTQATSGTTFNAGPLSQLETTEDLLGLIKVVPSMLFAWAYFRCRTWAMIQGGTPIR